jgi:arsenite methyltransferase
MKEKEIKNIVQQRYAAVARDDGCVCDSRCCGEATTNVTPLVNYGDLALEIVSGADLGLGCGIPTRDAGIRPGDTVLDLGCGAGVDVFLAAKAVGHSGRVIGVDMTPEMIAKAWNNAVKGNFRNVDFRLGEIEDLPMDNASVDVVISNCVINLAPDKSRVFAEIYRVLRPGGHFSISDMVTYGVVPPSVREDLELWAGCIAGAMDRDEYLELIRQTGFEEIYIKNFSEYDVYKGNGYGIASITLEAHKV